MSELLNQEYQHMVADEICHAFRMACESIQIEAVLPHSLMRPRIFIVGNQWCALYGENLQDGVAGFGESPQKAMSDFDMNWYASIQDKDAQNDKP